MNTQSAVTKIQCILIGFIVATSHAQPLLLAENGRSSYTIIIPQEASPSERYAAEELQRWLKESSGAELPIRTDADSMVQEAILLGRNRQVEQLHPAIDWSALGEEGYAMVTQGRRLILAGVGERATLYAVYDFLDQFLGCRWYTPEVCHIPKTKRIKVQPPHQIKKPALDYRVVGWPSVADGDWAARNHLNHGAPLQAKHGGGLMFAGGGHSFYTLLPPDRYFNEHPEYYAEISGRRSAQKTQPCLTNPDVIRIVTQSVRQALLQNPAIKNYWIGQEDWGGWCECVNCQAITEREGSVAGLLIHFINQVAGQIEAEFPDVCINTLAYQHTRKPPRSLACRHNVIVHLCPIECCFSHPMEICAINQDFDRDLANWSRLAGKLYIFDYTANFDHYIMPHPNLRVLQKNVRYYIRNGAKGIFESGLGSKGSEWGELRSYLLARLLWSPDCDIQAEMDGFLSACYGRAAAPLAKYIALIHDTVEKENIHCSITASPMSAYLRPEIIRRAKSLFDQAEQAADNETVMQRVQVARLPIQHVELEWSKPLYRYQNGFYQAQRVSGALQLAEQFNRIAQKNNITVLCEFENRTPAWHLEQQKFWQKQWPAVRLENDELRLDVVPGLGGRIVSLFSKKRQQELLLPAQADGREYPWSGGYEEYSRRGGRTDGWHEEFQFEVQAPAKQVRLWVSLANGLDLERTITLDDLTAEFTIHSRLSNPSGERKNGCLRAHPIFQMGPTDQVELSYVSLAGAECAVKLTVPKNQLREHLQLTKADRPNGLITAQNSKLGMRLEQRFNPAEVEECLIDWLPARQRFFSELVSRESYLTPGDSIRISHSYRILAKK